MFFEANKNSFRIHMIDYLKAICSLLVIINHYPWTAEQKLHPLFVFIVRMAVPIFMILSGYTFSMSAEKKHQGIRELYSLQNLLPKFYRFTLPVLPVYGFYLLSLAISGNGYSISEAVEAFVMGDYGPGSYYYGMMLQLLLFFPLIFTLVKKTKTTGLVIIFITNLLFEISIAKFSISYEDYRISLLRYFMYIAFGCYLYLNLEEKLPLRQLSGLFFVGLAYLLSYNYLELDWPLFQFWPWSALPVAFFIFPVIYPLLYYGRKKWLPKTADTVLSLFGKASYHIFLVQMLYYQLELDASFNKLPIVAALTIHCILCTGLGICYYLLENKLSALLSAYWKTAETAIFAKFKVTL